jgi:integrase
VKGIRRDRYGFRAYVKVGDIQREKRFKPETPIKTIQAWRDEERVALRAAKAPTRKDTLRADAKRYLEHQKTTLALATYRSRVCEIDSWLTVFGDVPRHLITREMILDARQAWLSDPENPRAPKTCNHRVRALRHLYRYIDGSAAKTPCDDVPKLKEPDPDPKFVSPAILRRVAHKLADPKTRARFMVLAATGQRPAQLKRAIPSDVSLRRRVWFVRPAKGGQRIPVILTKDMIVAWRAFIAADAWGTYDTSDQAKRLYAAGWPKGVRPYNAKHTVAITLGESEAEWEDIKDWFGHRDVKSTRIYTGQILKRYRRTSARLEGRIGWR